MTIEYKCYNTRKPVNKAEKNSRKEINIAYSENFPGFFSRVFADAWT